MLTSTPPPHTRPRLLYQEVIVLPVDFIFQLSTSFNILLDHITCSALFTCVNLVSCFFSLYSIMLVSMSVLSPHPFVVSHVSARTYMQLYFEQHAYPFLGLIRNCFISQYISEHYVCCRTMTILQVVTVLLSL